MTCVVGLVQPGSVVLGGDSIGVNAHSGDKIKVRSPKVWIRAWTETSPYRERRMGFGAVNSIRFSAVLRKMDIPKIGMVDPAEYLRTTFVDALRDTMRDRGMLSTDGGIDGGASNFLVALEGRLFHVMEDFSVVEPAGGYEALAAGSPYAKGSLETTRRSKDGRKRVLRALQAAEALNAFVVSPFHIVEVPA